MKTHMNNTQAKLLDDIIGKDAYINHQKTLHSKIKPVVSTQRKSSITIASKNKQYLNAKPTQQAKWLFNNLHGKQNNYHSTIDNQNKYYQNDRKIHKNKISKNKFQNFIKSEHQREIIALKNRVDNCKSVQQRKKDNYDPIVNPVYFMRDQPQDAEKVKLAKYAQKILSINKTKNTPNKLICKTFTPNSKTQLPQNQTSYGHVIVPNYAKDRPKSAKDEKTIGKNRPLTANVRSDLPNCTFRQILNHIIEKKIYKNTDLKVLYVRLCHQYGQLNIQGIWQSIMDELERDD